MAHKAIHSLTERRELSENLETLFLRALDDLSLRPSFYREFLDAELYLLSWNRDPKKKHGAQDLVTFEHDGSRVLPVFSSTPLLKAFVKGSQIPAFSMKGRELLKLTRARQELVLNPKTPFEKPFTLAELQALADGSIFEPIAGTRRQSQNLQIEGGLEKFPRGLLEEMRGYASQHPSLVGLYAGWLLDKKDPQARHAVIGLSLPGANRHEIETVLIDLSLLAQARAHVPTDLCIVEESELVQSAIHAGSLESFYKKPS